MNKTIAAVCVGLVLAAVAAACARMKYHGEAQSAPATHSTINSGWGPPITWDEIEIGAPGGAF
jgi:hypothetical protein